MSKLVSILQERFKKKEKPKVVDLAEQTSEGNLTVFSGVFGFAKLDDKEKENLSDLLRKYATEERETFAEDLHSLIAITSEVKAINNQAAMLHGERIKRAQQILKNYREGAFSAWLLSAYGNRQTPYNFLQYYEFYTQMPQGLRTQIEAMPRQAVYTLASRNAPIEKKEDVVRNYQGETKEQLITLIRSLFPLADHDGRRENTGVGTLKILQGLIRTYEQSSVKLSLEQKKSLLELVGKLKALIDTSDVQ
jgi:hypothetical protein